MQQRAAYQPRRRGAAPRPPSRCTGLQLALARSGGSTRALGTRLNTSSGNSDGDLPRDCASSAGPRALGWPRAGSGLGLGWLSLRLGLWGGICFSGGLTWGELDSSSSTHHHQPNACRSSVRRPCPRARTLAPPQSHAVASVLLQGRLRQRTGRRGAAGDWRTSLDRQPGGLAQRTKNPTPRGSATGSRRTPEDERSRLVSKPRCARALPLLALEAPCCCSPGAGGPRLCMGSGLGWTWGWGWNGTR